MDHNFPILLVEDNPDDCFSFTAPSALRTKGYDISKH
jgi:hypothetical protein